MQNLYNLIYREEEREMHPLCIAEGVALTPYSPNARGFLAGNSKGGQPSVRGRSDKMTAKMRLGIDNEDNVIADRVGVVADKLGVSRAAVALAWVLAKPGITSPTIGVSKPHHLDDALKALDVKLDAETMAFLEEPYRPKPVVAMD